jgi:hypothetical protein
VSSSRTGDAEFFLFAGDGYRLVAAVGQTFAYVEGVDRSACAGALGPRQDHDLMLSDLRDRTVCVLLGSRQVAALGVTAAPAGGSPRIAVDYVVWS